MEVMLYILVDLSDQLDQSFKLLAAVRIERQV